MNTFESSLLTELREHVATRSDAVPARNRRSKRLRWSALPVGAATAASAVAFVLLQSPAAAYAVDKSANGDVVVTIDRLSDAAGLQNALRADGINAYVNYDANLTLTPPPPGAVTDTHSENGSQSSPTFTSEGGPGQPSHGMAVAGEAQNGCGPAGPVNVSVTPSSVTFTIDASDIGDSATLYITTGGSQTGFSALQIRWEC